MASQEYAEQLGRAWEQHRSGKQGDAISSFEQLLSQAADNIDALYGRALAERAAGRLEEALATFAESLRLTQLALEANPSEDRYEMLKHMCEQRIAEIQAVQR